MGRCDRLEPLADDPGALEELAERGGYVGATAGLAADWARVPIELGHPKFTLEPIVVSYASRRGRGVLGSWCRVLTWVDGDACPA